MRRIAVIAVLAVAVAACAETAEPSGAAPAIAASDGVPLCSDVEQVSAPAALYGDSPVYVGNEMPVDEVRAWAATQPSYQGIWIDREHNGWITVAFSDGADVIQERLAEAFPGVGVVAVDVEYTASDLSDLQRRVGEALADLSVGVSASLHRGVVEIHLGVLSEESLSLVETLFAGEPVCVDGADPASLPAPGPQPDGGDGWRLLLDEPGVGIPYRTGIAWDQVSLAELWRTIGLAEEPPTVDFESEVVVWFGAVYSGSCPGIRLDDVVFDGSLVHAVIVATDVAAACTDDANPRAYVVAIQRSMLPAAPFAIQLGPEDPPSGVPEERTVVDADLRVPGSSAAPGEIHGDPALRRPQYVEVGDWVETGFDVPFRIYLHCGVRWLGTVNDVTWIADVPEGFVPDAWLAAMDDEQHVVVNLFLSEGPDPVLTLSGHGEAVVYRPTGDQPPGCD